MILDSSVFDTVWLDGAFVPAARARVCALDAGLLMGDGAFDTLHVVGGVPVGLVEHLDRLTRTADFLRLDLPPGGRMALEAACLGVIHRNGLGDVGSPEAALRITLTSGATSTGPTTGLVHARRLSSLHALRRADGVALLTAPVPGMGGELSRHKTTARAMNALIARWLREVGAEPTAEALLVRADGQVLEGSWSNVFAVEGRCLVTPPVSAGLLPGTARARVLAIAAAAADWSAGEGEITAARLAAADEVFITASTLHVAPVTSLDGAPIGGGRPGPAVRWVQGQYACSIAAEVAAGRARSAD